MTSPRAYMEILEKLCDYIDPDPVVYTRLAMVNKGFYHFFTSDKVWAEYNVYNKRNDIFKHFLVLPGFEKVLTRFQTQRRNHEAQMPEYIDNKHVILTLSTRFDFYYDEYGNDNEPCKDQESIHNSCLSTLFGLNIGFIGLDCVGNCMETASVRFKSISETLQCDPDVVRQVTGLGALPSVPTDRWTVESVELHSNLYPQDSLAFFPTDQYELARTLVLRNLAFIVHAQDLIERFMEDPVISPYLGEHWWEMFLYLYFECVDYGFCDCCGHYDSLVGRFISQEGQNCGPKELDREVGLRVLTCNPVLYATERFWKELPNALHYVYPAGFGNRRWFDVDFVIQAVKINKNVYRYLPKEYLLDKAVVEAA